MKKLSILSATLLALASPAIADPLEGIWKTEVDDGAYAHINISPCGVKFCGIIARSFNADGEYESPNQGKQLVIDMVPKGGNAYKGSIWRPSNDKIYYGKIKLNGDDLVLKGCVAGGLICSGQDWVRVK